jgi:hypothetical protein
MDAIGSLLSSYDVFLTQNSVEGFRQGYGRLPVGKAASHHVEEATLGSRWRGNRLSGAENITQHTLH